MRRISFIPRNVAVATIKQRFSAATMVGSESHRQSLRKSYEIESPSRSSYTNKHRRRDLLQVTGLSTSITMLERQTSSQSGHNTRHVTHARTIVPTCLAANVT
jgi:hypothetical protein